MKTIIIFFLLIIASNIWAQSNYENIRVFPSSNEQTEISAAIDPENPSKLFCGTNTYITSTYKTNQGCYYLSDNGKTWNGGDKLPGIGSAFGMF